MQANIESSIENVPLMDAKNIAKLISGYVPSKYLFTLDLWGHDNSDDYFSHNSIIVAKDVKEAYEVFESFTNSNDVVCSEIPSFDWFSEKLRQYKTPLGSCESRVLFYEFCDEVMEFTKCVYFWHNPRLSLKYSTTTLTKEDIDEKNIKKILNLKKCLSDKVKYFLKSSLQM